MQTNTEIEKIDGQTWRISEVDHKTGLAVDAYLVCGTTRAVLIDTLYYTSNLYDIVRELTSLPLDVILTHGHIDHVGASLPAFAAEGCTVYLNTRDLPLVENIHPDFLTTVQFTDLQDKQQISLGGRNLEIIMVEGHTPGSLVVLDRAAQMAFTGDTIGSGNFWMQLPEALPLRVFKASLQSFYENIKDLHDLQIYPGHKTQSPVQLTKGYIEDTLTITEALLSGAMNGEEQHMVFAGHEIDYKQVSHGAMRCYCYDPEKIN